MLATRRYSSLHDELRRELQELRDEGAVNESHRRTPANLAQLSIGWRYFLRFAEESEAITLDEAERIRRSVAAAFRQVAEAQADPLQDAEPAGQFIRLLRACVASGRAHVASIKGHSPSIASPGTWGWRQADMSDRTIWEAQGRRVGWLEDESLYLDPEAAHAEVQRFRLRERRVPPCHLPYACEATERAETPCNNR